MDNTDIIDLVPPWQANCLRTNKFFKDIAVVVFEEGNIGTAIAKAQALIVETSGKRGAAVIVPQIGADDYSNSLQFGPMQLRPSFLVVENVELNRDDNGTKKSARKIARKIRDVMKTQSYIGVVQDMRTAKPCIEPVAVKDLTENFVIYSVSFECLEVSLQQMTAVQMPAISLGANPPQFVLSCPTPGAAIWYTLDDSFPFNGTADDYPGNLDLQLKPSSAQLFVEGDPVNIPAGGCTLSARAYLDGENNIASPINRAFLPN